MSSLPALIKVGTAERAAGFLGLPAIRGLSISPNAYSLRISPAVIEVEPVSAASNLKKGAEELADSLKIIPAGRTVELKIGLPVNSIKYNFIVSINSALGQFGSFSTQTVVGASELKDLSVYFRADRKVNLDDLDWIIQLSIID